MIDEIGFTQSDLDNNSKKWFEADGDNTLRLNYDLSEKSIVVDVGGYLGNWSQDIYCKYKCQIYIYEPIKSFAELIAKKFSNNPDVIILSYGLGSENAVQNITFDNESCSLFKSSDNNESVKIKDVAQEKLPAKIDLMKINVEGMEYQILERLIETGRVKDIENIQVQFHIFIKGYEARREAIREQLSKTHSLTYDHPFIWENWKKK